MGQYDTYPALSNARIERICEKYSCSQENAIRYLDLKEEGYLTHEALLLAGITDPTDPDSES